MSEIEETPAENQEKTESRKAKFYRLDKSKPYKAEGAASKSNINFLIIFGALFIIGTMIFLIVSGKEFFNDTIKLLIPLFLFLLGGAFLAFGIFIQVKNNRQRAHERAILKDCILTDGRITECSCVCHRTTDSDGDTRTTYEVSLVYTYFDEELNERTGTFNMTYRTDPQFYKGQYLMIAFNGQESLIMREFTLEGSDMNTFLANEAARSDDFDSLTGEELDIDVSKPLKSFDGSFIWLIAGLVLVSFSILFIVVAGAIIIVMALVGDLKMNGARDVLSILGLLIMPCILIALSTYFLVKYFKSKRPLKTLMKRHPHFTYGKMFASEQTFRGMSKKVVYCYIDKWGEKHTAQTDAPIFQSQTMGEDKIVVVAYDAAGNSVVLTKYSFKQK